MFILVGHARAKDGCQDQLVDLTRAVAVASRDDPGCEVYSFGVDVTDPAVVLSVEVWRDRDALDAHVDHQHTAEFLTAVGSLVASEPVMSFFTADSVELDGSNA